MKKITLLISLFLISLFSFAQSRSTKADYQKESRYAIENDVSFPVKTVEAAIEDTMTKLGYKSTTSKGFTVYKGVSLPELGPGTYDLYFMVDKKSKRDKENSTVTMMISKGFDTFLNESADEAVIRKSKTYLDSMRNTLAIYDLEQQISAQENEVKSAEKKKSGLEDDAKDLEKKKRKLDDDISDNKKDQEKQLKEIEKQKQILETMKTKRKS